MINKYGQYSGYPNHHDCRHNENRLSSLDHMRGKVAEEGTADDHANGQHGENSSGFKPVHAIYMGQKWSAPKPPDRKKNTTGKEKPYGNRPEKSGGNNCFQACHQRYGLIG